MLERFLNLVFPQKSNWEDLAVHTVGAILVLVQVRAKANGAKQFRSVKVAEFMWESDFPAELTKRTLDEIRAKTLEIPRKPYKFTDRKPVHSETFNDTADLIKYDQKGA